MKVSKMFTKLVMWVLLAAVFVTQQPISVMAATVGSNIRGKSLMIGDSLTVKAVEGTNFDAELIEQMTAVYGDESLAVAVLNELYDQGVIDAEGNLVLGDTFAVGGAEVTREELRRMAESANPADRVTVDGQEMTWQDLQEMFAAADIMEVLQRCMDSEETLTEEHIQTLKSLITAIKDNGVSLTYSEDGEYAIDLNTQSGNPSVSYLMEDGSNGNAVMQTSAGTDIETYDIKVTQNEDGTYSYVPWTEVADKKDIFELEKAVAAYDFPGNTEETLTVPIGVEDQWKAVLTDSSKLPYDKRIKADVTAVHHLDHGYDESTNTYSAEWFSFYLSNYENRLGGLLNPVISYTMEFLPNTGSTESPVFLSSSQASYENSMEVESDTQIAVKVGSGGKTVGTASAVRISSDDVFLSSDGEHARPYVDLPVMVMGNRQNSSVVLPSEKGMEPQYFGSFEAYADRPMTAPALTNAYVSAVTEGTFYPGDIVCITVKTDQKFLADQKIVLTVNGESLNCLEHTDGSDGSLDMDVTYECQNTDEYFWASSVPGVQTDTLTFAYTVKEGDTDIVVEKISFPSGEGTNSTVPSFIYPLYGVAHGLVYSTYGIRNPSNANYQFPAVPIDLTSLKSEYKEGKLYRYCALNYTNPNVVISSYEDPYEKVFDTDNRTLTRNEDGSYTVRFPVAGVTVQDGTVQITDDTQAYNYLVWLCKNINQDAEMGYYLKSMYASADDGATRLPVQIEVNTGNFTYTDEAGQPVTVTDVPVAAYVNFMPETNELPVIALRLLEFYMDKSSNAPHDYYKEQEYTADYLLDEGFFVTYLVDASIFFEEDTISLAYNDTWMQFAPNAESGDYSIPSLMSYELLDCEETLKLRYTIKDGESVNYTYADPSNFTWKSSDEQIVQVKTFEEPYYTCNGKEIRRVGAEIVPVGVGTATLTLTVQNGSEVIEKSVSITIYESDKPYCSFPKSYREVSVLQDEAYSFLFYTNLFALNEALDPDQESTAITLDLYACDENGEKIGDVVYTASVSGTASAPVSEITIPEGILNSLSTTNVFSYVAELSGAEAISGKKIGDSALIRVKSHPIQVKFNNITSLYAADTAGTQTVEWTFSGVSQSETKEWYYVVTRKRDNQVIASGAPNQDFTQTSVSFSIPKVDSGVLKEIYNVLIYASNNPKEDGYAVDSTLLYVYNTEAIDLLVDTAIHHSASVSPDGDTVVLDNTDYVQSLLGSDGTSLDLEGHGLTFQDLREDVNLSTYINLNYGSYAWSLIHDLMKWSISAEDGSDATLSIAQNGNYTDVSKSDQYLPTSVFLLDTTTEGGKYTITATHAKTGIETTVTGTSSTLKNQLYLFQNTLGAKATVSYYDGEGVLHSYETNDRGELALYVPDGITSNVYARVVKDGIYYGGTCYQKNLRTSEQSVVDMQVYPVNTLHMQKMSDVSIYLVDPEGNPLADQTVILRGGVYLNDEYTPADLNVESGMPDGDEFASNGLQDQVFTTDADGLLTVHTDVTALKPEDPSYTFNAADNLKYAFELRFEDAEGEINYRPAVFEIEATDESLGSKDCTRLLTLTEAEGNCAGPFINRQIINLFEKSDKENPFASLDVEKLEEYDQVGPSNQYNQVVINSEIALWGYEIPLDETGQLDQTAYMAYFYDEEEKIKLEGQEEECQVYQYEFSTFPLVRTAYKMNVETLGGVETEEGINWDDAYLKVSESKEVYMPVLDQTGSMVGKCKVSYALSNTIGSEPTTDLALLATADQTTVEMLRYLQNLNVSQEVGAVVPGGDVLAAGISAITGMCSQSGDYGTDLVLVPTTDPMVYDVILSLGTLPDSAIEAAEAEEGGFSGSVIDSGDTGLRDLVSPQYDDCFDIDQLKKDYKEHIEGEKDEEEEEDEKAKIDFSGYFMAKAIYHKPETGAVDGAGNWEIQVMGGSIYAGYGDSYEYGVNGWISLIPYTISFEASASVNVGFGFQGYSEKPQQKDLSVNQLLHLDLAGGVEAFAGVGFDYTVIAAKIGVAGELKADISLKTLISASTNGGAWAGGEFTLNGGVGVKIELRLFLLDLELEVVSAEFSTGQLRFGEYDEINQRWSGVTDTGQAYMMYLQPDGRAIVVMSRSGDLENSYLENYERVWHEDLNTGEGDFKTIQENANPHSDVQISDDGQILVYVSDGESLDSYESVVCWAKRNENGGYTDMCKIDASGVLGLGDCYLSLAESDGNYYASWVHVTEKSQLEGDDNTFDDLSIMMRSSEICVGVLKAGSDTWEVEQLTSDCKVDMSPIIAADGNQAMVLWRSAYGMDTANPLNFDVEDRLVYTYYDGEQWSSDRKTVYNAVSGSVAAMDLAVTETDGKLTALAAYTINTEGVEGQTPENNLQVTNNQEQTYYTDTCYTYIGDVAEDQENEMVRVTRNDTVDENVQVAAVNDNGSSKFILGWYTEDKDSNHDIALLAVNADGTMDETFPDTMNGLGNMDIRNNFHFASSENRDLSELAVVWADKSDNAGSLQAVKFCNYEGVYSVTAQQEIAGTAPACQGIVDFFDAYTDGDTVYAFEVISHYETASSLEQDCECTISCSNYTFKEGIKITDVSYEESSVYPGCSLPVVYTIKNTGITPVEKLIVTVHGEEEEVQLNSVLMPGNQTKLTYVHQVGEPITDISYSISGVTYLSNKTTEGVEGTLKLEQSDICIMNMKVASSEAKMRTINIRLGNDSQVKLEGNDLDVVASLYADAGHKELLRTVTIPSTDTAAMKRIDNGVYIWQVSLSVEELKQACANLQWEVTDDWLDNGMALYGDVFLMEGESIAPESDQDNNGKSTFVYSLEKINGAPLTFEDYRLAEQEDGTYLLSGIVSNNTYEDAVYRNLKLQLEDANAPENPLELPMYSVGNHTMAVSGESGVYWETTVSKEQLEGRQITGVTLALDQLDLCVESMEVVSSAAKVRTLDICLCNHSGIRLEGYDQAVDVVASLYADGEHTELLRTITIPSTDTEAMKEIDNGTYIWQVSLTIEELKQACGNLGWDVADDWLDEGMELYAQAYLKQGEDKTPESNEENNQASTSVYSLIKLNGAPLTFENYQLTEQEDGNYLLSGTISNNTFYDGFYHNLTIRLEDANDGENPLKLQMYSTGQNTVAIPAESGIYWETTIAKEQLEGRQITGATVQPESNSYEYYSQSGQTIEIALQNETVVDVSDAGGEVSPGTFELSQGSHALTVYYKDGPQDGFSISAVTLTGEDGTVIVLQAEDGGYIQAGTRAAVGEDGTVALTAIGDAITYQAEIPTAGDYTVSIQYTGTAETRQAAVVWDNMPGNYVIAEADGTPVAPQSGTVDAKAEYKVDDGAITVDNTGAYPVLSYTHEKGGQGTVVFRLYHESVAEGASSDVVTVTSYDVTDNVYVLDYGLKVNLTDTTYGNGLFQNDFLTIDTENETLDFLGVQRVRDKLVKNASYTYVYSTNLYKDESWNYYYALTKTGDGTDASVVFSYNCFLEDIIRYTYAVQVGKQEAVDKDYTTSTPVMEANITIMPANVVYYEDNVSAVYTNGTREGTPDSSREQGNGIDTQYGYDEAYKEDTAFSNNGCTVLSGTDKFAFYFKGTGFDILTRTADASMKVSVYSAYDFSIKQSYYTGDDGTYHAAISVVKNTGVSEDAKALKTVLVSASYENGVLDQVPMVSMDMEKWGYYLVMVQKTGQEDLQIDGIRIYNPLSSMYRNEAEEAYNTTGGEYNASVSEVRSMILGEGYSFHYISPSDPSSVEITEGTGIVAGLVQMNGDQINIAAGSTVVECYTGSFSSADIAQKRAENPVNTGSLLGYVVNGPNNELYLSGAENAFATVVKGIGENSMLQIGLRAINGSATVEYRGKDGSWKAVPDAENLKASMDMYYRLPVDDLWQSGGKTVLMIRVSEGTASLTNIKYNNVTFEKITEDIFDNAVSKDQSSSSFNIISSGTTGETAVLTFSVSAEVKDFTVTNMESGAAFTYDNEKKTLTGDAAEGVKVIMKKATAQELNGLNIYVVRMSKTPGTYTITTSTGDTFGIAEFQIE